MSQQDHEDPTDHTFLVGAGVAVLMAACCVALPLLIAGGTLAGIGGFLGSPWLIGAGAVVLLLAVYAFAGRQRGDGEDPGCCGPSDDASHDREGRDG